MADTTEHAAPEEKSLGRKAAGGLVWSLLGFLVVQLGSFGTFTIAAHVIGDAGIGVVGAAQTLVFWIDILLGLGMGAALIYEQEKGQSERVAVAFTVNLTVGLLISAGLFVLAAPIDRSFEANDPDIFRVLALLVLIKSLGQVPDSMLQRDLDFRRRLAAMFTRSLTRFAVAVTLLLAGVGPISLVIGVTVGEALAVAVTWLLARFRPRLRFDWSIARPMLQFGLSMFGAQVVGMIWLNGDYGVLISHFGSESREFGNYFAAFRMPELILGSLLTIFSNVAFPAFSAARKEGMDTLRSASMTALRFLTLFAFPIGVGLALVARDLLPFAFGSRFEAAVPVMELLAVAGAFTSIGYASGDLYPALGKPRLGLYFTLLFVPVLLGGFLIFVDDGIEAIATVHVAVIVPYSVFRIFVANKVIGTTWGDSLRALRPAAVVVAGILALALPVRLTLAPGLGAMFAIIAAGLVGAVLGLVVGDRSTFTDALDGVGKVRAKLGR